MAKKEKIPEFNFAEHFGHQDFTVIDIDDGPGDHDVFCCMKFGARHMVYFKPVGRNDCLYGLLVTSMRAVWPKGFKLSLVANGQFSHPVGFPGSSIDWWILTGWEDRAHNGAVDVITIFNTRSRCGKFAYSNVPNGKMTKMFTDY